KLAAANEQHTTEKKSMQNDIDRLKMHNSALTHKDQARNPPDAVDGHVLVAKAGVPTAYINLGRKDMLMPGTMFRVKNRNSNEIKALAEVVRVEETQSEVRLSEVKDPVGDAVREGDELYNELYSPTGSNRRTIYLMGRFSYPYHKPELEQLLKRLQNKIVDKMQPGVDTVILGDDLPNEARDGLTPIADTPEFKDANYLGVEFVPLRKVRDLLKL